MTSLRRVGFVFSSAIVIFSVAALPAAAAERPNVLLIAIDDLNDWVGHLGGHPQAQTPHIDRLAARGTAFTNAHCQAPLCNPSRTSLLTGLRPSTTGIYGLAPWFRTVPQWKDHVSLPQYLRQHGYRTYSTGKIYHGAFDRGAEFDEYGPRGGAGPRPPQKFVETPFGNHPLLDWGVYPLSNDDSETKEWEVAEWARQRLSQHSPEQPFFLAVGFFFPHVPCYATQKWFDLYPPDSLKLPPYRPDDRADLPRFADYLHWRLPEPRLRFLQEANQWENLVRAYLAATSFTDHLVGRVLDVLQSSGQADKTIVVLWSDHGWHLGEKDITGKNTLWERSTRVPLVWAGPNIAAGGRCAEPAELLDIFPTLIELCGLPPRDDLEGHSLVPQLRDANTARAWPAITTHNQGNHTVRTKRWRYIQYADGTEELYDHDADPNEWTNLADQPQHAQVLAEHRRWLPRIDVPPAPGSANRVLTYDPATGAVIWEGQAVDPHAPLPHN